MNTQAAPIIAAPATGSTSPGNAAAAAAAAAASRPGAANTAQAMQLTPGLEQLDQDAIMAAFMGSTVAAPDAKQKEDTNGDPDPDADNGDGDGDPDPDPDPDADNGDGDGDPDPDADKVDDDGKSDLDKGLENELKDKPGLHKRVKQIFGQNKALKAKVETLEAQVQTSGDTPAVVLQSSGADPLASASTEAMIETAEEDAQWWMDWCEANRQGGTLNEGTDKEVKLDANQVTTQLQAARKLLKAVPARREWLKKYAATAKVVGNAKEFTDPKADSREAKLLRTAPELMRDPEYLQVLADAKAGREHREKQAKGITFVEVNPKKVTKPAEGEKPQPQGSKAKVTQPVKKTEEMTTATLSELRERAAKGDQAAKEQLMAAFLS